MVENSALSWAAVILAASTLNFGLGVLKEVLTATADYELDEVTILLSDSDRLWQPIPSHPDFYAALSTEQYLDCDASQEQSAPQACSEHADGKKTYMLTTSIDISGSNYNAVS